MEQKGITMSEHLKGKGQALLMLWIKFNFDNEPANCLPLIRTGLDISEAAWPGIKAEDSAPKRHNLTQRLLQESELAETLRQTKASLELKTVVGKRK